MLSTIRLCSLPAANSFASVLVFGLLLWVSAFCPPVLGQDTSTGTGRHGLALHGAPKLGADQPLPYAQTDAASGGRIVFGAQGVFDTLNPFVIRGIAAQGLAPPMGLVFQSLMIRSADEPFSVYGGLARSVDLADDFSTMTVHLEPEARFSDGKLVSAEDVEFSFALLKDKGRPTFRGYYGKITAITVVDPLTIRFRFEGHDRELPLIIALMPVLPKHATQAARFEETSLTAPVGSGPYRVAEVKAGESIRYEKNPDFWGKAKPIYRGLYHPQTIRFDYFRDSNTLFEAFKGGLVDVRIEDNPSRWAQDYDFPALKDGRVLREVLPVSIPKGMTGFVFNTRKPLFADLRVREALGTMLDFEWINRSLFFGLYRRSNSYFSGSSLSAAGLPASTEERALLAPFPDAVRPDILAGQWQPPALDGSGRDRNAAAKALSLLNQAGWTLRDSQLINRNNEVFAFELLVNSRLQEKLALNYAQSLARIGIILKVRLIDDIQYWRRLSAFDFEMIQFTWSGSPAPGNEQYHRWGSKAAERDGSLNYAGARSPAIDAMIEAVLAARTPESYLTAIHALDRVLLSGFYVVPLFYAPDLWMARKATVKHPARLPLLGTAPETFWVEDRQ
jgi:peptide/nickel transport system substrate-binding protein